MQQIMLLYDHLSDYEVLNRMNGGNTYCYEVLVRRHARLLYRIARIFNLEATVSESLTEEVFVETYQARAQLKSANSYRYSLAQRMIDHCKELHQQGFGQEDEEVQVSVLSDKLNVLEQAIDVLPYSLKAPVVLCALESFSTEDAAKLLGIKEDVVDARLKLANSRMRGRLLKWYHAEDVFSCDSHCTDRIAEGVMARIA